MCRELHKSISFLSISCKRCVCVLHTSFILQKCSKFDIFKITEGICVRERKKGEKMEEIMQRIKEIEFATVEDLYEKREEIREGYKNLEEDAQRVYKWYFFYQLCLVDYDIKSAMWDYICEIGGAELELNHQYRIFKEKKERLHLKYILEDKKKKESN